MNEVALAPSRLPIQPAIAKEYDLSPAVWRVLVEQIFPSARTVEAVLMALAYCRERKLDILKRPVHIVPMWSAAKRQMVETVWPGIAEIRTTACRTGQYAGIDAVEFGPMVDETFSGETGGREAEKITKTVRYPEWASVVVYRMIGGQRCPFHTKVYWEESYATVGKSRVPNDMWAKRPRGQLDKCVEAAALRKAFPEELGAVYAAEEMEGHTIDHDIAEPDRPTPPRPPTPPVVKVQRVDTFPVEGSTVPEATPPTPPKPPAKRAKRNVSEIDAQSMHPENTASIYDAETGEVTNEDPTPFELLSSLDHMLSTAADATQIEEIWDGHDVEARFESLQDGDTHMGTALAMKRKHIRRVASNG